LLFAFNHHGNAARELRPSGVRAETQVHQFEFRMFRDVFREAARQIFDGAFGPRGEREDVGRPVRQSFRARHPRSFLDNDVRVRASKSKTADSRETPRCMWPGLRRGWDFDSRSG
jgi:hypothetical protein